MPTLNALTLLPATLLSVPSLVFTAECLAALAPPRAPRSPRGPRPSLTVLVPAHDEAAGLGPTLEGICAQLHHRDRLLVVADNCSDDTAAIARAAGAEVVERDEPERRGKGYALARGRLALLDAPTELVVVVDADCQLAPGALDALAYAAASGRPAQATYLLAPAGDAAPSALSALAFLVRNRVRPRGLARLGGPTQLTGSGMALPFALFAHSAALSEDLVEDLSLGVRLTLAGHAPRFVEEARVSGRLPNDAEDALGQRRRWEHGHLRAMARWAPRLFAKGLTDREALLLGLDLLVPPLSLLLLAQLSVGGVALLTGQGLALAVSAGSLGAVGLGLGLAWARFGRELIPAQRLLAVPGYVAAKLPLYTALFTGRAETRWVRTRRDAEPLP